MTTQIPRRARSIDDLRKGQTIAYQNLAGEWRLHTYEYTPRVSAWDYDKQLVVILKDPPLVLPTEPTWGIVVNKVLGPQFGRWRQEGCDELRDIHGRRTLTTHLTVDFIPLTEEQVQRIEAAR